MATGFNIRDVDPDAFIDDQRQSEGKGGDRGTSLQIIEDVLQNSKGLFDENGLGDDIAEKLKSLWISKLEAFGEGSKNKEHVPVIRSNTSKKGTTESGSKNSEPTNKFKRRKKGESKAKYNIEEKERINSSPNADFLASSSILSEPKSISLKKSAIIGGQVDGPNDTSDEDEDIGKAPY